MFNHNYHAPTRRKDSRFRSDTTSRLAELVNQEERIITSLKVTPRIIYFVSGMQSSQPFAAG